MRYVPEFEDSLSGYGTFPPRSLRRFAEFFAIYPANQWTANRTTLPDDWEQLQGYQITAKPRTEILALIGLCAATCSVVSYRE
jgi:hypothetical protein